MNVADALDDGWLALAGVGAGYALAAGLVFLLVFAVPSLAIAAL
ncbi:hypothetical protein [Halorubrum sp. Atlit-26R]|nr:hypothetical protein [Halorubrum sp. Atlit-26R]